MAITTQAFKLLNTGNAIVASQQNAFGGLDMNSPAFRGKVTFTLDGTATSATINWIDGTKSLGYTPSGVNLEVIGGTQPAAAIVQAQASAFDDKTCTVKLSAAGTAANTLILLVEIYK